MVLLCYEVNNLSKNPMVHLRGEMLEIWRAIFVELGLSKSALIFVRSRDFPNVCVTRFFV